jgi:hypothetical protein
VQLINPEWIKDLLSQPEARFDRSLGDFTIFNGLLGTSVLNVAVSLEDHFCFDFCEGPLSFPFASTGEGVQQKRVCIAHDFPAQNRRCCLLLLLLLLLPITWSFLPR